MGNTVNDIHYRALIHLEKVAPYTDEDGLDRERTTELASICVTGDSPADAMHQITEHAEALYGWHDRPEPTLDEAADFINAVLAGEAGLAEAQKAIDKVVGMAAKQPAEPATETAQGKPCPCDQFCPDGERCDGLTTQEAVARLNAEAKAAERPFVACKAPDPNTPGWFCGLRLGHDLVIGCSYRPIDQLPASADDEGDEDVKPVCGATTSGNWNRHTCDREAGHSGSHRCGFTVWTDPSVYNAIPGGDEEDLDRALEDTEADRDAEMRAALAKYDQPERAQGGNISTPIITGI